MKDETVIRIDAFIFGGLAGLLATSVFSSNPVVQIIGVIIGEAIGILFVELVISEMPR